MIKNPIRTVTCADCNKQIDIPYTTYTYNTRNNKPFRCKECFTKYMSNKAKSNWNNKSPEEKKAWGLESKKHFANLSDEAKERLSKYRSNAMKSFWANANNEQKKFIHERKLEGFRQWYNNTSNASEILASNGIKSWNNKSDKEKAEKIKRIHKGHNEWFKSLSQEELELFSKQHSDIAKSFWETISDDYRDEINKKISTAQKAHWESSSTTEIEAFSQKLSKAQRLRWENMDLNDKNKAISKLRSAYTEWYNNLPAIEKEAICLKIGKSLSDHWNNLPDTEKELMIEKSKERWKSLPIHSKEFYIHKALLASQGRNKLHQRFENEFKQINSGCTLQPEYSTYNNTVLHSWDYAILAQDTVLLVDIDGKYFHGDDQYDYDGIHGKFEYDINRGRSIPDNTKHCIIREGHFEEDWKWLLHIINLTYDEFINEETNILSSQPFPHPSYTDNELIYSWNKLSNMDPNNKYFTKRHKCHLGDHLVYHFCKSLFDESIWTEDYIQNALINHTIYYPHMNKNKIVLTISHGEFTPPGQARIMMKDYAGEYIDDKCDVGMMLGCVASHIPYRTTCMNPSRYNEINNILEWMNNHGIKYDIKIEERE